MTTATTLKRRPAIIVSAFAYADRCRRVDELQKLLAERDTVIAAQRAQIRDLRIAVLRANKRAERAERRGCGSAPEAQTKKRGCGSAPEAQLKSEPAP